jgi:hypothetical protein
MFFAVVRLRLTGSQKSEISGDGVVVGVVLAVAFETTELVAVAVVFVGEATVNVTTPLTGVLWCNLLDSDAVLGGFILGVLLNTAERPLLETVLYLLPELIAVDCR